MSTRKHSHSDAKKFGAYMLSAFAVWSIWCVLMASIGNPFDQPVIRALVRFIALAGPAVFWLYTMDKPLGSEQPRDRFGLFTNWRRGVMVGVGVSLIWALLHIGYTWVIPNSTHSWLNVILLSPIAEELLFRRAAIEYGIRHANFMVALLGSSLLFAGIHLPWWLCSGDQSTIEVLGGLCAMFTYGLVFGALYISTRSTWASLIPHWANNFIASCIES